MCDLPCQSSCLRNPAPLYQHHCYFLQNWQLSLLPLLWANNFSSHTPLHCGAPSGRQCSRELLEKILKIGQLTLARKLQKARRKSCSELRGDPSVNQRETEGVADRPASRRSPQRSLKGHCPEEDPGNRHGTRGPSSFPGEGRGILQVQLLCWELAMRSIPARKTSFGPPVPSALSSNPT